MARTLSDFSQLKRSMVKAPKPVEVKPETVVGEHNDGDDVLAYFSRSISGKKHWKLEYGNVRMPLSKTPSDYRSNRNSASEIANKCF